MNKTKVYVSVCTAACLIFTSFYSGCSANPSAFTSSSSVNVQTKVLSGHSASQTAMASSKNSSDTTKNMIPSIASDTSSNSSNRNTDYLQYANGRYGFSVEYPSDLTVENAPANGDGATFSSKNGSVSFRVFGSNNVESLSPSQYFKQNVSDAGNVVYKAQKSNWYVVSYKNGKNITYQKCIIGDGSVNSYVITYPASRKAEFDIVIQHINSSFKTGDLSAAH